MAANRYPLASLMLGAAGIVYGDIGTSVLYALKEVFSTGHLSLTPGHVYGVLSATEGLRLIAPWTGAYIVPLTLAVLFALFLVQRQGTASIGRYFGPVMLVWFIVIGLMGLVHIVAAPQILWALLPVHAIRFIVEEPGTAFVIAGVLVLCVTGVEALYADMGHFGRRPIRLVWFGLVMPALLLNYFGQGALLLADASALRNPFYLMAPSWALPPLVMLATLCTVIASQALISGAFSITKQAI